MNSEESTSHLESNATHRMLWLIFGLLGGLLLGGLKSWKDQADVFESVNDVIVGGIAGSALSMVAVLVTAHPLRQHNVHSVRGLLILAIVCGVVLWFALGYLRLLLG